MSVPLSAFQSIQTSVSGYTFATPFECTLIKEDEYTEAAITNEYNLVWWFGDGNYSNEYAPSHIYTWPGIYEIKLQIFNNTNSSLRNLSTLITAVNYINDALTWDYSQWPYLSAGEPLSGACFHGYQSSKSGLLDGSPIPITLNYSTTVKETSSIRLQFYAQNSLSQPWTQVLQSQLVNTRPRWRFTTVSAAPLDDGYVIPEEGAVPLSSTEIRILSSGVLSSTGTLVGLSGTYSFYYIDDTPSLVVSGDMGFLAASANPTTIWITLDTTNVSNYQDFEYINVPSYSNSIVSLSSFFYVQTLTADHINITVDGVVNFYNTYWPTAESRFVTTINSYSGVNVSEYVANKILLNQPTNINQNLSATYVVSYSAQSNNGLSAFAIFNASTSPASSYLDFTFSKQGFNVSTFTPYTSASVAILSAFGPTLNYFVFTTDLEPDLITGYNPQLIPTNTYAILTRNLSGFSTAFGVPLFNSNYFARKFGGAFDYGTQLKEYALQPTINQNSVFFDNYLPAVAGVSATNEDTYGGVVFEKIANYVSNTGDVATANINEFYSLTKLLGLTLDNYNFDIPPTLSRIFDLYSTQQSTVWGARSQFARNFANKTGHNNLGQSLTAYDINSTIVSAGQKIVVQDLFKSDYYELLEVPAIPSYASITARNLDSYFTGYITSTYPLTAYPLSGFYGWGLQIPVSSNYRFFVYNDTIDNQQKEGLINWDDPYTTLSEASGASHAEWVRDEGSLEVIFNYYLHKGLGLID